MAACSPDQLRIKGGFGEAVFRTELADDPQERARGLMHRESLPRLSGMLFVYERPERLSFWMRNTLIPLDMLFIDADGRVGHIHDNAVPLDETPISGTGRQLAVFEINGGLASELGLAVGDVIQHPAMPQDAALWPCPAS